MPAAPRDEVMKFGASASLRRPEDSRLLTGGGRYLDDLRFADAVHAVFVRSPHAHARIATIDTQRVARLVPPADALLTPMNPLPIQRVQNLIRLCLVEVVEQLDRATGKGDTRHEAENETQTV